jgi:N-dimethylarginine dimethylaminohydrolase
MKLLMSPPAYYGIEYEINPWMSRSHQSDRQKAGSQWQQLRRILEESLRLNVRIVEPEPGLPDMVFTANAGFVWKKQFIVSNFRYEVRRGEARYFEKWFRDHGFEIIRLPQQCLFEGEGDLLKCGQSWFAGYHIRSDITAHHKVAEIIEQEILSLELTNDWFYHLDTCFCPLGEEQALFYPAAFDRYALTVLEGNISRLIEVSAQEAARFACNAIVAGTSVIMNDGCPRVREQLESLGFTVFQTPLGEFLKAGGSAKCLVLIIRYNQP